MYQLISGVFVSIHSQGVRVFILQLCQKMPPICSWRTYITTRHTQTHTPSHSQTHTLLIPHSLIHIHQQEHVCKLCLPQTQKYTQTCWQLPTHTLLHTQKQMLEHAHTHTPSWYSCNRCLQSRQPTQSGMSSSCQDLIYNVQLLIVLHTIAYGL